MLQSGPNRTLEPGITLSSTKKCFRSIKKKNIQVISPQNQKTNNNINSNK